MEMFKIRGKKADISSEKTLAIILVVLLIAVIVLIIFRQKALDWIRSLPGFELPEESVIDVSKISDDEIKSFCPEWIGYYKNAEGTGIFKQYYIFIRKDGIGKQTSFYRAKQRLWDKEYTLIRKAQGGADPEAGDIYDNEIIIKPEFLSSEIGVLNGAWFVRGNLICKREVPNGL